jgi:hypothetical protein
LDEAVLRKGSSATATIAQEERTEEMMAAIGRLLKRG